MGRLAPVAINFPAHAALNWPMPAPPTPQQITDKLTYWAELLRENTDAGTVVTRIEITTQLDRWLDELVQQRGQCWHPDRLTQYCQARPG